MKIAIITSYWNPPNFRGGISRVIFELRKELQKMGHTVDIFACYAVTDRKNGIYRIPIPPLPLRILWINLYMNCFIAMNKYDILFPQSGLQCIFLDKKKCIPFIHTLFDAEHIVKWRFWQYARTPLEKYALRNIRGCITLDEKTMNDLQSHYAVAEDKILKINNGVNFEFFSPGPDKKEKKVFIILTAGRFIPRKRFDLLIEAFAIFVKRHGEAKLIIAGDGDLKNDLQHLVHRHNITQKVSFPGMVDEQAMLKLYQHASIFVLPSVSEGMPMVVLEAQSCALPVVLAAFESASELVINGETGYIVQDTTSGAWAETFDLFYDQAERIRHFGESARNRIMREFGWPAVARKIINHFESIVPEALKK